MRLPGVIAHADWGTHSRKRQLAVAVASSDERGYEATSPHAAPDVAGDATALFRELATLAPGRQVFVGFDFPIGLPRAYAELAGVSEFRPFLNAFETPPWQCFADVAASADEIGIHRPFYPARSVKGVLRSHLYEGLGLDSEQLRRVCEGRDAEILFWTLGGKQVGKGALSGWRMLAAAQDKMPVLVWPFDARLDELLDGSGSTVVVETYPREYYRHIATTDGSAARWSKRTQAGRKLQGPGLLAWADRIGLGLSTELAQQIAEGFSPSPDDEDRFDAVVGLVAMVAVARGQLSTGEPTSDPVIASIEGWILGRAHVPSLEVSSPRL